MDCEGIFTQISEAKSAETSSQILTMLSVWLSSSLFAFSAERQILGGYLVWLVLTGWSVYFFKAVYTFKDPKSWRAAGDDGEAD